MDTLTIADSESNRVRIAGPLEMESLTGRNVLVIVDPSFDAGTAALDLAARDRSDTAGRLTVIVSLSGQAAAAFCHLSAMESITTAQAAGAYLARLAAELSARVCLLT